MITCHQAFYQLNQSLLHLYDAHEATAIAHEILYDITGMDKLQRLVQKEMLLTSEQNDILQRYTRDLQQGRPLQYVLGHAWFLGRQFRVDERVLIPRPETEELVQWITGDYEATATGLRIFDIGTGSGCIPVSLKLAMPDAVIEACDVSADALQVAGENAAVLGAEVRFFPADILSVELCDELPVYDIMVSNPPYIPETEKSGMHVNVREFEPSLALFTPDDDPQIFYRAIAELGLQHLAAGGAIYCELHRDYADASAALFATYGYRATLRKDMHGNPRMLKAVVDNG